ncbi:hypothetical protein VTP01DRAFT_3580 [Rhizomucor pusillus]|uniref:uncharacterized protein n=1 Tax=Rhizomucor pusillus TaxID=4840 RepID=UPI0037449747
MVRVPVTILTGFLGAGKTTLLNRILDATSNKQIPRRIGVIENEFAAAFGIENEIIHQDNAQDIQNLYEFGWGCVCCSSSGELINALVEIANQNAELGPDRRIEHVILETTGLADPGPVLRMIKLGADGKGTDDIVQNFYVDGIITVLDGKNFFTRLRAHTDEYKNEPLAQILTTDYVVINKIDLLDNAEVNKITEFINQHNPKARIFPATYAQVPLEPLFHLRSPDCPLNMSNDAETESSKLHDPSIEQSMLLVSNVVDKQRILEFIQREARQFGGKLYRIKGVLALPDSNKKWVVQGVGSDISIEEHREWDEGEPRDSRLTFIGKDMKEHGDRLQKEFEACLVPL